MSAVFRTFAKTWSGGSQLDPPPLQFPITDPAFVAADAELSLRLASAPTPQASCTIEFWRFVTEAGAFPIGWRQFVSPMRMALGSIFPLGITSASTGSVGGGITYERRAPEYYFGKLARLPNNSQVIVVQGEPPKDEPGPGLVVSIAAGVFVSLVSASAPVGSVFAFEVTR